MAEMVTHHHIAYSVATAPGIECEGCVDPVSSFSIQYGSGLLLWNVPLDRSCLMVDNKSFSQESSRNLDILTRSKFLVKSLSAMPSPNSRTNNN